MKRWRKSFEGGWAALCQNSLALPLRDFRRGLKLVKGKITPSLQGAPTRGGEFEDIGGIKAGPLRNPYEYLIVII
jgi:hypothetical protein